MRCNDDAVERNVRQALYEGEYNVQMESSRVVQSKSNMGRVGRFTEGLCCSPPIMEASSNSFASRRVMSISFGPSLLPRKSISGAWAVGSIAESS
jgi:hypothetical protein